MENRLLFLDIETLPARGLFWDKPWETSIIAVEKEWQILSFSAKWLGSSQETYINHRTDRFLMLKLWKLLDSAEVVVGHNLDKFDIHQDIKNLTEIATKTNGRIKSLEIWRARLAGGMAVVILLLVPIVIQYFSRVVLAYFK